MASIANLLILVIALIVVTFFISFVYKLFQVKRAYLYYFILAFIVVELLFALFDGFIGEKILFPFPSLFGGFTLN